MKIRLLTVQKSIETLIKIQPRNQLKIRVKMGNLKILNLKKTLKIIKHKIKTNKNLKLICNYLKLKRNIKRVRHKRPKTPRSKKKRNNRVS